MTTILQRLGRASAARPWRTLCTWAAVLGVVLSLAWTLGGTPRDDYKVPGARAHAGLELLREHVPGGASAFARVVVHDPDGTAPADAVPALVERLRAMPHVASVAAPLRSADGDTALIDVGYDLEVTDPALWGRTEPLEAALAPARDAGWVVESSGSLPESAASAVEGKGELVGILVAVVVLLLTLRSVLAAGLPVVAALAGLAVSSGGIALLAAATMVSTSAPVVASMVGVGVGIDYALLVLMRFTDRRSAGAGVVEAAGDAVARAGRAVLLAASTVLLSLFGLRLAGLPTYDSFASATAIGVVAAAAVALTLVPALAAMGGPRVLPRAVRRGTVRRTAPSLTARWARVVERHPLVWALLATVLLLAIAAPATAMRTWPQDASTGDVGLTTRQAHDLVVAEFGPGVTSPLVLVADRALAADGRLDRALADIAGLDGVAAVTPPVTSPDGAVSVANVIPDFESVDERTPDLVAAVRALAPPGLEVTGTSAFFVDISTMLAERLWLVILFVVGTSVVLLTVMFRSVVVPLKAALLNLLSIAAAYGAVTAVFQWGWGASLFGVDHPVPVSSWLPILMFTILFGLSMDYEVFLLARVREEFERTGDGRGSVVAGLAGSGRVVTAAAAIMVAVFLGFALEIDLVVRMVGVGMAVAVFLDATVVRMVLVPATMTMLGARNWWLPRWLDAVLPRVRFEPVEVGPVAAEATGSHAGAELVGSR